MAREFAFKAEVDEGFEPIAFVGSIGLSPDLEHALPKVKTVLFNKPATILFWDDEIKTVVKCHECTDGCIFDKDFLGEETCLGDVLRRAYKIRFCREHYSREKAIMAGMLKRLYPNYQEVLRRELDHV